MSDTASDDRKTKEKDTISDIDATIGFERSPSTTSTSSPENYIEVKQFRDLAFAAAVLGTGEIAERHLVRAITNWTTHGRQSLADHLVRENAISEDLRDQVEASIEDRFAAIETDLTRTGKTQADDRKWLRRLDRSGRLARMLGIADESMLATNHQQARTIGARYTLLRKLGQGGLGTVWLARDENLRRYVALKEISRQLDQDDLAMAHFRREAEITGSLEHPSIVPIYQFGTDTKTGRGFYAMRFLGKRTLQDALIEYHERRESGEEEPMLRHRLMTAFVNVCQAVAHAHSRHIIHRDLKPENIALDSFGQVVLLDWGLAKIEGDTGLYEVDGQPEPGDLHNVGASYTGRVLGTPLYMAPEQAAGRLEEVDHLTDIYGLGGILFAILTGVAPHAQALESGNKEAADVFSTIVSHPPKSARELVPDVPPELDAICKKALSAKRYLRYESASALAEDVQRYLAGTPVTAYETPATQRLQRWMSRHPTTSQLVLLMASLLALGTLVIGYTMYRGATSLQAAKYAALDEFTRELEVNLQFDAQGLLQDIHFITDLPLSQQIVAMYDDASRETNAPRTTGQATDEPLQRQGTLFDGLLRANPAYLVASTVRVDATEMQEILRSERFAVGMHARRIPLKQLGTESRDRAEVERENEIRLEELRPGEVRMVTADRLGPNVPTRSRSPLVLIAVSPIVNEDDGELFGLNVIQLDLRKRLEDLLKVVAPGEVTVYITDHGGNVAMSYPEDSSADYTNGKNIVTEIPQLADLFEPNSDIVDFGNDRDLHATRVNLGFRNSRANWRGGCLE